MVEKTVDTLQLDTPRLPLRLPRAEDLDPWAEMMADEEAARFGIMARAVSWRGLMTMIDAWHAQGFGFAQPRTGKAAAPFEDAPVDIWGQSREEGRGRSV